MSSNTPKTILLLTANPKGTTPLRLDEEVREISEGLLRSQHREQFKLVQKWAVRPQDIHRAILDEKPQIMHFSGHGDGEEGLVFEDEVGKPKLVAGKALAGLFKLFADRVGCVVLNGCYSHVQAKAVAQHVPYVVGMKRAIGDEAAIAFAVGFYDALGAGETIEFAYELGRNAIQMKGISEHLTPVLLKRKKDEPENDKDPQVPLAPHEYELLVKDILRSRMIEDIPGKILEFKQNACYTGKSGYEHQIGVSAEMKIAGVRFLILVDCKKHSELVEANEVLEFASRLEDIGAQKGIIVTTHGFESGAIQLAKSKGIALIIACNLKWEIYCENIGRDISLRQNFIRKGLRLLERATKLDIKRLSALYAQSAEHLRAQSIYRFGSATNLNVMRQATHAYIFVTDSVINGDGDADINHIPKQFRLENYQLFVLLREGIFSFIALDSAYAIGLGFAAKAILLNVSGLVWLFSWLALPLPDSRVLCVLNKFNTFLESLPKGDFKQAFELLRQIQKFDNRWEFENFDNRNCEWQEIANWGWQEIAYALETPECFDKTLKLAQKAEIYDGELEQLAVMVAERGRDDQAIALANCIQFKGYAVLCPNQEQALTLARIANRIARAGNLIKAANLFSESLQISQGDPDMAMSQALGDFLGVESSGVSKQNKVLVEMALLAAEASLIDQAIQIAQTIKSEKIRAEVLAKISRMASP